MVYGIIGKAACCCIFLIVIIIAGTVTLHEPITLIVNKVTHIMRQAATTLPVLPEPERGE